MSGVPRLEIGQSPDSAGDVPTTPAGPPGPGALGPGADRTRESTALTVALWTLRAGPAIMLALVVLVATLSTPLFLTTRNLGNVLDASAVIAVLGIGQLLVIITRGIDLSVGSTVALASVLGALLFEHSHSGALVIAAMLATGVAVGLVNGIVFVYGRVPHPFIVTLATLSIVRGLALVLSHGEPKFGMPKAVVFLGGESIGWFPHSAFVVGAMAVVTAVLLGKLVWGRWIYAVGGNPDAARRAGIPVDRILLSVHMLSGLAAGIAAILIAGRTDAAAPQAGQLLELDAITAVIIGGASFLGGRGRVTNVLAGALIIGVIRNGLNLLDVTPFWQSIAIGVLVIASLELDVLRGRLEERLRVAHA
jgi:ribose transport system permease protein